MQIRIGNRRRIQFTDRTHPMTGIISVISGIVAFIALVVICFISCFEKGMSGIGIGIAGMFIWIVGIVGFVLAIRCFKKEEIYMTTPTIGSIINGILLINCMILYFIGAI